AWPPWRPTRERREEKGSSCRGSGPQGPSPAGKAERGEEDQRLGNHRGHGGDPVPALDERRGALKEPEAERRRGASPGPEAAHHGRREPHETVPGRKRIEQSARDAEELGGPSDSGDRTGRGEGDDAESGHRDSGDFRGVRIRTDGAKAKAGLRARP